MAVLAVSMRLTRPSICSTCALSPAARSIAAAAACAPKNARSHGGSAKCEADGGLARCMHATFIDGLVQ